MRHLCLPHAPALFSPTSGSSRTANARCRLWVDAVPHDRCMDHMEAGEKGKGTSRAALEKSELVLER